MVTKRNEGNIESANLELALEQLANEQKFQTKSVNELLVAINSLSKNVTNFEEKIKNLSSNYGSINTLTIKEIVKKTIIDNNLITATQNQKPVLKKYQLLLFPEQDAKVFYKIVFGRWILWLTIMLFLTNLYKFSVHYSDSQREIQLQILENDRVKRSWDRLYLNSNRGLKKLMDSAYSKTAISRN